MESSATIRVGSFVCGVAASVGPLFSVVVVAVLQLSLQTCIKREEQSIKN
jgi:hypothetical protein